MSRVMRVIQLPEKETEQSFECLSMHGIPDSMQRRILLAHETSPK